MDTSETYIKMRLKAIPDLGMGQIPKVTLGFPINWADIANGVWVDKRGNFYHSTETDAVQIERQDQLQEMLSSEPHELTRLIADMEEFGGYPFGLFHGGSLTSMEQLWLSFVMHERCGKEWNGEDWAPSETISAVKKGV
jgi:hypothetical protein